MTTTTMLTKDNLKRNGEYAIDGEASFAVEKGEVIVLDGGNYAVWMSRKAAKDCEVKFTQVGSQPQHGSQRWTLCMPSDMVDDTLDGSVITDIGGWNIWVGKKTASMKFSQFFATARKIEFIGNGYGDGSFPCHAQVNGDVGSLHMNQRKPESYRNMAQRALDAWLEANTEPSPIATGALTCATIPAELIQATWPDAPFTGGTCHVGLPVVHQCKNYRVDHWFFAPELGIRLYDNWGPIMKPMLIPVRMYKWYKSDGTSAVVHEPVKPEDMADLLAKVQALPKAAIVGNHTAQYGFAWGQIASVKAFHELVVEREKGKP